MNSPLLKQFGALKLVDFEKYPVWVSCHVIDYDEPWYDGTDEETFRPWTGDTPIDPDRTIFLVKTTFVLADGTVLNGFITPVGDINEDATKLLGTIQPCIFSPSGKLIHFWFGGIPFSEKDIKNMNYLLGKGSKDIFPIQFKAESGLAKGIISGTIVGFYHIEKNGEIVIKK
jgi:hypothetical protein